MQITFNIPEFTRNERNLHCDVLHITTVSRQTRPGWCDRSDRCYPDTEGTYLVDKTHVTAQPRRIEILNTIAVNKNVT